MGLRGPQGKQFPAEKIKNDSIPCWENSPYFRLALLELHRENHPWVYLTECNSKKRNPLELVRIDYDCQSPKFNQASLDLLILERMSKIARVYDKNYSKKERKLYDIILRRAI